MGLVDFTNPDAVKWYTDKLRTLLDAGVDCFKTDFGERIPVNVVYHDGSDPHAMHNYYTFLYNKAVFQLLKEEKGEREAVLFARSATAGSQKFPVHWGGDCFANYPSMAETIRGGLSFAMSGFSFWSHDISGFESTATPDLYKRWAAFGLLSSHSRLHGSGSYRVPWLFDEEACDVVAHFSKLKCTLMPYLYAKAIEAHEEGTPMMRPMVFEYRDDPAVAYLDSQYMLGDALLVAPILREDTYDYFSLPLYVKENTLLAVGRENHKPDYDYENPMDLRLYQLQDGAEAVCRVPDVDGHIVNVIRAKRTGRTIELTSEKPMPLMKLTLYMGTEKTEYTIERGKQHVHTEIK